MPSRIFIYTLDLEKSGPCSSTKQHILLNNFGFQKLFSVNSVNVYSLTHVTAEIKDQIAPVFKQMPDIIQVMRSLYDSLQVESIYVSMNQENTNTYEGHICGIPRTLAFRMNELLSKKGKIGRWKDCTPRQQLFVNAAQPQPQPQTLSLSLPPVLSLPLVQAKCIDPKPIMLTDVDTEDQEVKEVTKKRKGTNNNKCGQSNKSNSFF